MQCMLLAAASIRRAYDDPGGPTVDTTDTAVISFDLIAHQRSQRRGRLLGTQLVGHRSAKVSKRVDTYATLFHEMSVEKFSELDLYFTPPLVSL